MTSYFRTRQPLIDSINDLKKEHDNKVLEEVKKKKKIQDIIENKSFLYFKDMHGGGVIRCHGCGYKGEIISSIDIKTAPSMLSEEVVSS